MFVIFYSTFRDRILISRFYHDGELVNVWIVFTIGLDGLED